MKISRWLILIICEIIRNLDTIQERHFNISTCNKSHSRKKFVIMSIANIPDSTGINQNRAFCQWLNQCRCAVFVKDRISQVKTRKIFCQTSIGQIQRWLVVGIICHTESLNSDIDIYRIIRTQAPASFQINQGFVLRSYVNSATGASQTCISKINESLRRINSIFCFYWSCGVEVIQWLAQKEENDAEKQKHEDDRETTLPSEPASNSRTEDSNSPHMRGFAFELFNWPFFDPLDTGSRSHALSQGLNQAYASFALSLVLAQALRLLRRYTFSSYQSLGNQRILAFSLWIAITTHRQYVNIVGMSPYYHTKRDVETWQPQQNLDKQKGEKFP